jgi:SAM-dependent methyltransferase
MRIASRIPRALVTRIDRATAPPRQRYAENVFWTGKGRWQDRIASMIYFHLSVGLWSERAHDKEHLASFDEAISRCTPPRRALDLGTGAGASAELLAVRFPQAEIVGLDGSRRMIQTASRLFRRPNLRFITADVRRLPFGDGYFDLVTMLNALPEPNELRRVLVPGGVALVANSYFSDFDPIAQRFFACGLRVIERGMVPGRSWLLMTRDELPQTLSSDVDDSLSRRA